jgi:AcrR family transcriptional regulator
MAGQRRRLAPDARRRAIVHAARTLFAERSYGDVTTADVAQAAGVARSLVHHYFGGIRGVFLAVVGDGAVALADVRTAGPETPLDERLARNVAAALDVVAANRETWLAVAAHGPAAPDPEIRAIAELAVTRSVERALEVNADVLHDTPATRLALRAFHAFSTEATLAWLTGQATRAEVEALLATTLRDVVTRAAAPDRSRPSRRSAPRS